MPAERRDRILDAARLIAARVTDPARIAESVALSRSQTAFPLSVAWNSSSVAQGDAGQALLCAELARAFPDEGWDRVGHQFLARAAQFARLRGTTSAGVVSGLGGIAFTARLLSDGDRYRGLRSELDRTIAQSTLALVAQLRGRSGVATSSFDLISGLSGIAMYLLPPDSGGTSGAALPFALRALIESALADGPLPAWHTPVHLLYDDDQMRQYPDGNLNCGLAHGVPGPLAALSLAMLGGQGPANTGRAVERLADWLVSNAGRDGDGPRWPAVIPTGTYLAAVRPDGDRGITRDAWCYGNPGVARALYLAGEALDRADLREFAIEALGAVFRRPPDRRGIDAPTFCHGVAGLLQISLRFAHDTDLPMFHDAVADLTEQVLAAVDADRPMGVANIEPGGNPVDQPGLLDGATGVCLTLLSAASERPPPWDRIFGLS